MLEPLTVAFVAPLLPSVPWKADRLPSMVDWESEIFSVQWQDTRAVRDYMHKFWNQQDGLWAL